WLDTSFALGYFSFIVFQVFQNGSKFASADTVASIEFILLIFVSPKTVFSYQAPFVKYKRLIPFKAGTLYWTPTGPTLHSNIKTEIPAHLSMPDQHYILLQFGSDHPSRLFSFSFKALEKIRDSFGPNTVSLVFVGISQERVNAELVLSKNIKLKGYVHGTGPVSDSVAAYWMNRAKLVLAPFEDGTSARRTSTISALSFGKTVVTTRGPSTDTQIPWEQLCVIAPSLKSNAFAEAALKSFANGVQGTHEPSGDFTLWFSWPKLCQHFVSLLS
ncbi:MAG: glycosyltransferase, partial [Bdellovibrionota bacterium]